MLKALKLILSSHFYMPVPAIGCGVLGLALVRSSKSIGEYASDLLKALEYRGYDSTGAAIQDGKQVTLLKDVGAPSVLVETLGIQKEKGKLFCGQVRWATFGRVDKVNSQPHVVKCKRYIYGAHNGNITNTSELKEFLVSEGHTVLSDNDGEMVVHMVEHYFDIELGKVEVEKQNDLEVRRACMRKAIPSACEKLVGSFAAVLVDPQTEIMYTIKAGSSLYFGVGEIEGKRFALASSDLTAVLRYTKNLVDLKEGEFVEYTADHYEIIVYKDKKEKRLGKPVTEYKRGQIVKRSPARSKLRAEDTELLPDYEYFMEQEISAEVEATGKLVKFFLGGSNTGHLMRDFLKKRELIDAFDEMVGKILKEDSFESQKKLFSDFKNSEDGERFYKLVQEDYQEICEELIHGDFHKRFFFSEEKNVFIDLAGKKFDGQALLVAKALDSMSEQKDVKEFDKSMKQFVEIMGKAIEERRNIYVIACGSSYHAAMIGALYFNEIAGVSIRPALPGDFRGQYSNCLSDHDVIMGVSQSGETKDLIDIIDNIEEQGLNINKIMLVNNMNSTLGQEKSDVSIPIACGPEIAVPATKSFVNQLTLFYYLAIRTFEKRIELKSKQSDCDVKKMKQELSRRWKSLENIPPLIKETIRTTQDSVDRVSEKIFIDPSMQILATKMSGVAKEGALKIRETVLNHTEGSEASEFKHGPNTILGKNTTYGLESISHMTKHFHRVVGQAQEKAEERGIAPQDVRDIVRALSSYIFERTMPFNLTKKGTELFKETLRAYDFFEPMVRNYPLIYITGPDDRDVNLTISQMNTHKIRGANTFIIAEENDKLSENARFDDELGRYSWDYIKLPATGDSTMVAISSTVVMQLLSLKMSVRKMKYLDKLGMAEHGVHPDVPKNVSKSITVD